MRVFTSKENVSQVLVYLKWRDSYGVGSSWTEVENIPCSDHYCHSVGWIIKETDDAILVAAHMSIKNEDIGSEEQACGDMLIPKVAIVERRMLML